MYMAKNIIKSGTNMQSRRILTTLKKNALNILLAGLILLLVFIPGTKSWLLQQWVSTGLVRPTIKKEGIKEISTVDTDFSFTDATGKITSTADLKGKVVFINFWASWCPPCQAEMPSMQALYNKFTGDERFVFIFINEDEDKAKAEAYIDKNNFTMPMYSSAGYVPAEVYNGSLPTTIVLNTEGKVVLKKSGIASYNTESFIQQLKDLL
jgi:thiol-disulfide isomerase/thioredoxin